MASATNPIAQSAQSGPQGEQSYGNLANTVKMGPLTPATTGPRGEQDYGDLSKSIKMGPLTPSTTGPQGEQGYSNPASATAFAPGPTAMQHSHVFPQLSKGSGGQ